MKIAIGKGLVFLTLLFSSPTLMGHPQEKKIEQNYQFIGRHFVASYYGCNDAALKNIDKLRQTMKDAVHLSGATLLDSSEYIFAPDGFTMVLLLSESHASIHTYPEYGACFVDFFTCGTHCMAEQFDDALRAYLRPDRVEQQIFTRH